MKLLPAPVSFVMLMSGFAFAANPSQESQASHGMHMSMKAMCEKMDTMEMSQEPSVDFVKMMIPHHQSAVEMSQAYLKEGTDPRLVAMAQKIIESQKKEIEELQNWLKQHGHDTAGNHP